MQLSEALDLIGNLVASLRTFSAKVPAYSPTSILPGGFKPTPEAVESYEQIVYRFRDQAGKSVYKSLSPLCIESLEAFEAGRVFDAVQPLLIAMDQLEQLIRDHHINQSSGDQERMKEYRAKLHRILPSTLKPEVDLPKPEIL